LILAGRTLRTPADLHQQVSVATPFASYSQMITAAMGSMYEEICQMTREQITRPDFYAIWQLLTAWGKK